MKNKYGDPKRDASTEKKKLAVTASAGVTGLDAASRSLLRVVNAVNS